MSGKLNAPHPPEDPQGSDDSLTPQEASEGVETAIEGAEAPLQAILTERKGISKIWFIPMLAALIGAGLVYTALTKRGPLVTITFKSADGVEAKKTKVKYKDVVIGKVKSVKLTENFSQVRVKVRLAKEAEHFLSKNTRFWIVRPRRRGATFSGLDTLLSGAYIAVDPGSPGDIQEEFIGLEVPPVVTRESGGKLFTLEAESLGSLDYGSPVYYRDLNVGRVVSYRLRPKGDKVDVQVLVDAPYDAYVSKNARFWTVSGIDVELNADGVRLHTKSLMSLMVGGVAFMTPPHLAFQEPAVENQEFHLFEGQAEAMRERFERKRRYVLKFTHTIRGLEVGDPVEFKGFPIGRVVHIGVEFNWDEKSVLIPVDIEVEEERLTRVASGLGERNPDELMSTLVEQGMRAQVLSANLLTGKRYVSLDFVPSAPPASATVSSEGLLELPTYPTPMEELIENLTELMNRVKKVPINEISWQTLNIVKIIKDSLAQIKKLLISIKPREVSATIRNTRRVMQNARTLMAEDSRTIIDLQRTLRDLSDAAKSVRHLANQLERHPESLLRGRERD